MRDLLLKDKNTVPTYRQMEWCVRNRSQYSIA